MRFRPNAVWPKTGMTKKKLFHGERSSNLVRTNFCKNEKERATELDKGSKVEMEKNKKKRKKTGRNEKNNKDRKKGVQVFRCSGVQDGKWFWMKVFLDESGFG